MSHNTIWSIRDHIITILNIMSVKNL